MPPPEVDLICLAHSFSQQSPLLQFHIQAEAQTCHSSVTHHNAAPLVELDGQISVRLHPLGVGWVHDGLAGGADGDGLRQLSLSWLGHPSHLHTQRTAQKFTIHILGPWWHMLPWLWILISPRTSAFYTLGTCCTLHIMINCATYKAGLYLALIHCVQLPTSGAKSSMCSFSFSSASLDTNMGK